MAGPPIGIGLDANALDEAGPEQKALVDRFKFLVASGRIRVIVGTGVRSEALNPRTPGPVRDTLLSPAIDVRLGLDQAQQITRIRVRAILRGDAPPGKHDADALNVCEASEAGCAYFITHDKRILRKRDDLRSALPTLTIVPLARFLEIFARFETE